MRPKRCAAPRSWSRARPCRRPRPASTTGSTWKACAWSPSRGVPLGEVSHLLSTGANDVMVVRGERERLLPFVQPDYVKAVDFEAGTVTVDWDPEF